MRSFGGEKTFQVLRLHLDNLNIDRFCGSEGLEEPEGLCGAGFYCALGATSPAFAVDTDPSVGGLCAAGYACVEVRAYRSTNQVTHQVVHDKVGYSCLKAKATPVSRTNARIGMPEVMISDTAPCLNATASLPRQVRNSNTSPSRLLACHDHDRVRNPRNLWTESRDMSAQTAPTARWDPLSLWAAPRGRTTLRRQWGSAQNACPALYARVTRPLPRLARSIITARPVPPPGSLARQEPMAPG